MRIKSLTLRTFRAHKESELSFSPKINLIYGPNGSGKTNILEAIHYLCLSKSFLTNNDRVVLQLGAPFFEITGSFTGNHRKALEIRVAYHSKEGKRVFTNGAPIERVVDLIGKVPLVSFAPDDVIITAGPPSERRRFINNILCQEKPSYLKNLSRFRRVVRQRNELLSKARRRGQKLDVSMLAPWDAQLVLYGSKIIAARIKFVTDFGSFLKDAYQQLNSIKEIPSMEYQGIGALNPTSSEPEIQRVFYQGLNDKGESERKLGRTLVGPHRDEFRLSINELELRRYASQGQHRTFGIAIKLAQLFYLNDRLEEPPILLLDDVFDSLDQTRTEAIVSLLEGETIGQSLITAAGKDRLGSRVSFSGADNSQREILGGSVSVTPEQTETGE